MSSIYNHRNLHPSTAVPVPPPGSQQQQQQQQHSHQQQQQQPSHPQQQQQQQQQHPSTVPGPSGAHASRLGDMLDAVKREFEALNADASLWKSQRDEMEAKIALQIQETALIRQNLYDLEAQHVKIRNDYENEISHLRRELELRGPKVLPGIPLPHQQHQAPILPSVSSPHGREDRGRNSTGFMGAPPGLAGKSKDSVGLPGHQHSASTSSTNSQPPQHPLPSLSNGSVSSNTPSLPPMQIQNSSIPGLLPHQQQQQQQPQSQPSSTHSPLPSSSHLAGSAGNTGSIPLRGSPNLSSASAGPALTGPFASNPPPPPRVVPQLQQQQQQQQQHQQMLPPPPNSQQQRDIHDRQARLGTRTPTPGPGGIPPPPVGGVVREQQTVVSDIDPDVTSRDLKKEGSDWVVIWSPKAKKVLDVNLVHNLVHESIVCCVKFSNDGKWLGTGCNRTVQIFDTKTGAKSCVLQDDSTPYNGDLYIRTICFSPDGKLLATGAEDRQIRIWDIKARRIRHLLQGHSQEIYSLEFSSDGRHLVSGSGDKSARIWDIENGACVFDLRVEDFVIGESGPVDAGLTSVAVSPDGRYVAAGSLDAVVRIWDTQTGVQLGRFTGHSDSVYSVAFAPDGSFLCSGSLDRTLRIWDLSPPPPSPPSNSRTLEFMPNGEPGTGYGACHNVLAGHKDYVLSVGVSNDGRWIASGSKDRSVLFFDSATNQPQLMLQGHKNSVISIDLSKSSGLLATGSGDLNARIWRYDSVRD